MYVFTQEQRDQIVATANDSASSHPFADMYDLIHSFIQQPDALGNTASGNVIAWFGAAAQANLGQGGASNFIRDYTESQLVIRTGNTVSNVDSLLQAASDDIAQAVLDDIINSVTMVDGETYYVLPTLHEIGEHDALSAMGVLTSYSPDLAVWSGNPLFLGLGDGSFWNENILTNEGETYNLFAAVDSFKQAGMSTFLSGATADLVSLFWSQGQNGRAEAVAAVSAGWSAANAFLGNAYGGYIGSGLANMAVTGLVVGSEVSDFSLEEDSLFTSDTFMHGGAGDDLLIGSLGSDLLDGGGDQDGVSFEVLSVGEALQFSVTLDRITSSAQFSAEVTSDGVYSALFNIEELSLGVKDDTLNIRELSNISTSLEGIDGGGEEAFGDTVNLSPSQISGADISLDAGTVSLENDAKVLNIVDFENVIGTSRTDNITGNTVTNILVGGDGADQLDGGAGDDILVIDADDIADGAVSGGTGRDIAYVTGSVGVEIDFEFFGIEVAVGSSGSDDIYMNGINPGLMMAAGGDGNDTFYISSLAPTMPAVVWGGAGTDTFHLDTGANILTATVVGLTSENFADFDLDILGLGASFDWSLIDAVVINPDSDDKFFYDDTAIGTIDGTYNVYHSPQTIFPEDPEAPISDAPEVIVGSKSITFENDSYERFLSLLNGTSPGFPEPQEGSIANNALDATGIFNSTFLGDQITTVQTSVGVELNSLVLEYVFDENGNPVLEDPPNGVSPGTADFNVQFELVFEEEGYSVDHEVYYWVEFDSPGTPEDAGSLAEVAVFDDISQIENWFVAGGSFDNLVLSSDNSIVASMPGSSNEDTIFDWLESVGSSVSLGNHFDPISTPTQNGTSGTDTFSYATGDGQALVTDFDVEADVISIDDVQVNPTLAQSGVAVSQVGLNSVIDYGTGDQVILIGTDLSSWIAASASIIDGTSGADIIDGTFVDTDGESISNDGQIILAGGGDDEIHDGSGDDVVDGGEGNDLFFAGDGADQYIGGAGRDELFYSTALVGLTIDMINGANSTGIAAGDTFSGIEVLHGSNFDDVIKSDAEDIYGRSGNDQFLDVAGNQNFYGGSGDDTFTYLSGNDVIQGNKSNYGTDTLDLSNYTSDQVSFSVNAHDVMITTPDGVIELDYQVRNEIGHSRSNIEALQFSDVTLTEQDIRDRAISDQSTAGNDVVIGTSLDDVISAGAGDDIIIGNAGNDTFIYTSGNDVIQGNKSNYGTDTLDLSIYTSDQVSFSVDGYDVLIATPDGIIELDYQVRNAIGSVKSNIEILLLSDITMDEQGIYDAII